MMHVLKASLETGEMQQCSLRLPAGRNLALRIGASFDLLRHSPDYMGTACSMEHNVSTQDLPI